MFKASELNRVASEDTAGEKKTNLLRMYTDHWQTLTGKRTIRNQRRNFEEMLMAEIPGAAEKTNLAMHAVLESELDSDSECETAFNPHGATPGTPLTVRNHALLHYFANLARSNNFNDKMDFAFVQSLVKNGASINTADKHGQTVFHEVARSWHTDVAKFLLDNGADLNKVDKFGRSPLHVASAVDYVDMVEFLLENGAQVDAKTFGECQTALHFAAKNDAVNAMKMLLVYKSDINCTDYKDRTPLQVAAELNRAKSSTFLINAGASAAVCDSQGNSVISLLIERLPSVALKALDQFHLKDRINRKQFFYLNCLEPRREDDGPTRAKTPLERDADIKERFSCIGCPVQLINRIPLCGHLFKTNNFPLRIALIFLAYLYSWLMDILRLRILDYKTDTSLIPTFCLCNVAVLHNQKEILLHPVFKRLINVKWKKYGKIRAWGDLLMNVFYAIFWTILCVTQPKHPRDHYNPLGDKWWRIVLEIIVFLFTCYEARKQFLEIYGSRKEHQSWIAWKTTDLSCDKEYCHPRWPEELRYLEQELKSLRGQRALLFKDAWNHFEWFTCAILLATVLTYMVNYFYHSDTTYRVHMRVAVGLLIALWLRIMKYARPFRQTGPFVIILGHITADFLKWAVLFFIIYIPYSASFWMVFGGVSPTPVKGYGTVSELMFNVFRMTVVDQYNFHGLAAQDPTMAKLLCGTYIALSAVIILNILIALLSHTFQRVYDNAKSNAVMLRAKIILNLERSLSRKRRKKVHEYVITHCSPEVLPYEDECWENELSFQASNKNILTEVEEMFHLVHASLGKRCGMKAKSDFDSIMENVQNIRKSQQDLQEASLRIRVHLMKLENFFHMLDSPKSSRSSKQSSVRSRKAASSREPHASPHVARESPRMSGDSPRGSGASQRGLQASPCGSRASLRGTHASPRISHASSRGSGSEGRRSPKPKFGQRSSLPLRRKCGVASLQHDPELYTSYMKTMTPSLKKFAEHGQAESSDSILVGQSTVNNDEKTIAAKDSLKLTWDGFNNTLVNSEERRDSLVESRQHTATESHTSDNHSDSERYMNDEKSSKTSSDMSHQSSDEVVEEVENLDEGITNFGLNVQNDSSLQNTQSIKEKQS